MGYLLNILLALASLGAGDLGWTAGSERPWAVPALALAPYLLGWLTRRLLVTGRFRLGALCERLLVLAPVVLQLAALCALGWLETLERWSGAELSLDGWPTLWLCAGLAPFFLYQCTAIGARARALALPPDGVRSVRAFQLRLFLSALLPILLYLSLSSLVAREPALRVRLEQVGLLGGLWTVLLLVAFVLFLPFFLRHAWDTAQLEPGGLRSQLEDVARRAGYRWRELLVWNTGQQMANAVIVGFTARTRLVLFSDLLLAQLGPRELAAVFAHEMGHARRGHAAVFAAFALTFFLAADLLVAWSGITSTLATLGWLLLVLVLWYLAFGFLSRRFELEADLESLRVLGESGPLVRALELVTGAHAHQRSSWRHFSTKDRVLFLQEVERDPVIGLKLRLALLRWRRLSFALFGLAVLFEGYHLARSWDEDWVLADLRLGRYEQAGRRAERGDVAPDTAALAQLAASLPGEARSSERLEERALQALARGDLERTRDLLGLAVLRGADELDPVWTALDRHLAGEAPGVALEEFPETWRQALAERAR